MKELVLIIITALCSGLIATIITLWWQNKAERKKNKFNIFNTLMSNRFFISHTENVKALNSVQSIFYNDKKVCTAWHNFFLEVNKRPDDPTSNIQDAYISLLEEISKSCGYTEMKWKNIKEYYYPNSLFEEINENVLLRKSNLVLNNSLNSKLNNNLLK